MTIEDAKQQITSLVQQWRGVTSSQLGEFNEENTKNIFIQPLFESLGWDFHDLTEVTAEHGAGGGRVDFAFRINGVSRFYLEAKPLRTELTSNPEWQKQAVSYAYSKGIPWVVLTNFKDLWLFTGDVEIRRFLTLSASNFEESLERLWLLSKESLISSLLEAEGAKVGAIPPRVPVEQRLYEQLKEWREALFTQIHLHRPQLSLKIVDEVIQKFFNRLIFIRTCEDRNIEEHRLRAAQRQYKDRKLKGSLLDEMRLIFRDYDSYYDSELFRKHLLDGPTNQVFIEDPTIEKIIQGLHDVPGGLASYDFSVIDADILGAVYEQYLGHVSGIVRRRPDEVQVRLARGLSEEQAYEEVIRVVERPRGRKEKGIYYTPKWVVDYIVKQTVGKFVSEKSSEAIHNLKILDLACGSGSFLIRAYDELLRWHAENFGRTEGEIDPQERTEILRNNIFGVYLDPQAVEIARLNLLLRALA